MKVKMLELNRFVRGAPAGSLLTAMAMLWLAPAHAAWDAVPEIGLLVDNNDNPRLEPTNPREAARRVIDARVTLSNFGERGNIFVEPRIRANSYADEEDEDLENDDKFFRSYGQYAWQTVTSGFYAEFQRRSIQSSEFRSASPADPNLPPPPD